MVVREGDGGGGGWGWKAKNLKDRFHRRLPTSLRSERHLDARGALARVGLAKSKFLCCSN